MMFFFKFPIALRVWFVQNQTYNAILQTSPYPSNYYTFLYCHQVANQETDINFETVFALVIWITVINKLHWLSLLNISLMWLLLFSTNTWNSMMVSNCTQRICTLVDLSWIKSHSIIKGDLSWKKIFFITRTLPTTDFQGRNSD